LPSAVRTSAGNCLAASRDADIRVVGIGIGVRGNDQSWVSPFVTFKVFITKKSRQPAMLDPQPLGIAFPSG